MVPTTAAPVMPSVPMMPMMPMMSMMPMAAANASFVPQMNVLQQPRTVTSDVFEGSQMSIVREFCIKNSASTFRPQQIGYIYAEKSVSGQVAPAPPPSDFDKYGLPKDHLKYPVVISYENHWYLPCSLDDKCRIHHDLL